MIHDVRLGQEYVLTDRGVPTARIIPYRQHRWVSAASVSDLLNTAVDNDWLREIRQLRESVDHLFSLMVDQADYVSRSQIVVAPGT